MTTLVSVVFRGGPRDGEHNTVEKEAVKAYISDPEHGEGLYRYDGFSVNPRRFYWVGWEKNGYIP